MEQDIPDYDMDSEDERFVNAQAKKMDLTPLKVCYFASLYLNAKTRIF